MEMTIASVMTDKFHDISFLYYNSYDSYNIPLGSLSSRALIITQSGTVLFNCFELALLGN